jgi:hypothetical protein
MNKPNGTARQQAEMRQIRRTLTRVLGYPVTQANHEDAMAELNRRVAVARQSEVSRALTTLTKAIVRAAHARM